MSQSPPDQTSPAGPPIARPPRHCPYVGLSQDRDSLSLIPIEAHRCYVPQQPKPIASSHQAAYCLTEQYAACPVYVAGLDESAVPIGGIAQAAVNESRPDASPTRRSILWPAVTLALALLLIAVLTHRLRPGQASEALLTPVATSFSIHVAAPDGASGLGSEALPTPTVPRTAPSSPVEAQARARVSGYGAPATSTVTPNAITRPSTPSPVAPPPTTEQPSTVPAAPSPLPTAGAATAPLVATATLRATAVLTPSPEPASALVARVARAEADLQSGEFVATLTYPGGARSEVQVRFELGQGGGESRLHSVSAYVGETGTETLERIVVGDRAWQHQPDQAWTVGQETEGVWGQVQAYLPHAELLPATPSFAPDNRSVLRWHEAGPNADVSLRVDPATGVPRELRRESRTGGAVLVVTYTGWNTPVRITPPATP